MITRRSFVKAAAVGAIAPAAAALARTAPTSTPAAQKFILGAPLTHSDWMLKPNIAWGPAGVRHMLDQCRACGWSRVYWRVLDGGRADYPSKVVRPFAKWDDDSFWSPRTDADRALIKKFNPNMTDAARAALMAKFDGMNYG